MESYVNALKEVRRGFSSSHRDILFIDGVSSHKCVDTFKLLSDANVVVAGMFPNLTAALQLSDTVYFNRELKAAIRVEMDDNPQFRQHPKRNAHIYDSLVRNVFNQPTRTRKALKATGWVVSDDCRFAGITEESAHALCSHLRDLGKFNDGVIVIPPMVRNRYEVHVISEMHKEGAISDSCKRLLTEEAWNTREILQPTQLDDSGKPIKTLKTAYRAAEIEPDDSNTSGILYLNSNEGITKAMENLTAKREKEKNRKLKREQAKLVKAKKDEDLADRNRREVHLRNLFPQMSDADWTSLLKQAHVGRYLTGNNEANDLEWAKQKVKEVLQS